MENGKWFHFGRVLANYKHFAGPFYESPATQAARFTSVQI